MKNLFLTAFFIAVTGSCSLAQIYIDPSTSAAMASQSVLINSQLNTSNNKLTLLERAQLSVSGELAIANQLQSRIFRGLTTVSSAVSSLLAIKDINEITQDILADGRRAVETASSNPALLLFAQGGADEFYSRAMRLSAQVGSFVLNSSAENLMDSGERAKLLNHIVTELSILRGVIYGIYRVMYWAKVRGFWNSVNPYSRFINSDKLIARDVIFKSKLLKR
ncbi:hypothetical protein [Pedobacter jamesrossensis]|uniref:DUF4141 domain-containing protein n=1 Tax=Pedobacter jamesrossensis TaxID=1908238 RepID=A0ABV8NN91_9SPHI